MHLIISRPKLFVSLHHFLWNASLVFVHISIIMLIYCSDVYHYSLDYKNSCTMISFGLQDQG